VVFLQGLVVGFGDVDTDEVRVVLIFLSICQALKQDLDETEASAGERTICLTHFISVTTLFMTCRSLSRNKNTISQPLVIAILIFFTNHIRYSSDLI
jgi:hypothetical protein